MYGWGSELHESFRLLRCRDMDLRQHRLVDLPCIAAVGLVEQHGREPSTTPGGPAACPISRSVNRVGGLACAVATSRSRLPQVKCCFVCQSSTYAALCNKPVASLTSSALISSEGSSEEASCASPRAALIEGCLHALKLTSPNPCWENHGHSTRQCRPGEVVKLCAHPHLWPTCGMPLPG